MELRAAFLLSLVASVVKSDSESVLERGKSTSVRIVGGENASPGEWPWQGAMFYNGRFLCGCSLINNRWAITAAHCTHGTRPSPWSLLFGANDRSVNEASQVSRGVVDIIDHPGYDDYTLDNDISLLELDTPVPLSDYIRPIGLPSSNEYLGGGVECWITGWGATADGSLAPQYTLQEVAIPTINNSLCSNWYRFTISPSQLCAGYEAGGKDTCQGDSGGPFACQNAGEFVLHGITSFGDGCAQARQPGVYTRVSMYVAWINQNTGLEGSGEVEATTTTTPTPNNPTTSSSKQCKFLWLVVATALLCSLCAALIQN